VKTAALRVLVSGRVQGVGFRYSASRHARMLGLTGWVRNLDDGRVELLAEGSEDALERLAEWLRAPNPPARVDNLEMERRLPRGLPSFEIIE